MFVLQDKASRSHFKLWKLFDVNFETMAKMPCECNFPNCLEKIQAPSGFVKDNLVFSNAEKN